MENMINEDSLYIQQFLRGEEKGFEMLVDKYQNRVLNIVYSLVGTDRESEDISQEVFLKVYNNLRTFRQQSAFFTWLYRIVVNTTYDALRRRRNFVFDEEMEKMPDTGRNPAEALAQKERERLLRKAMEKVPVKYRTAVALKDIDGLDYKEISRILGCSIGTVESRIFRGRRILRQELEKLEGGKR